VKNGSRHSLNRSSIYVSGKWPIPGFSESGMPAFERDLKAAKCTKSQLFGQVPFGRWLAFPMSMSESAEITGQKTESTLKICS
jgi:hypothetical protein